MKIRVSNIFKVIITAFLVITFLISFDACKEAVIEEQQEDEKGIKSLLEDISRRIR